MSLRLEMGPPTVALELPACRSCGCTEQQACLITDELDGPRRWSQEDIDSLDAQGVAQLGRVAHNCSWIEPDLCSACVKDAAPPLLTDANGRPLRGAP